MKITRLEYQKNDPNRVNVYVDANFAVGLNTNDIIKLGLFKDQEISQDKLNLIIAESEFGKLFSSAVNFLSFRPRSEWETKDHLVRKLKGLQSKSNGDESLVDSVLTKLRQLNYVNDADFAQWYLDQRQTFRPKGTRALKIELQRKGLESRTIQDVFEKRKETGSAVSEEELALRAAEKKAKQFKVWISDNKSHADAKIKLQRFLSSRGFNWDTIDTVVDKLLGKRYNIDS